MMMIYRQWSLRCKSLAGLLILVVVIFFVTLMPCPSIATGESRSTTERIGYCSYTITVMFKQAVSFVSTLVLVRTPMAGYIPARLS